MPHDVQHANNTLTTLASAAILLSFSVFQAFATRPLVYTGYLVLSWVAFTGAVLLGVAAAILLYIVRAHNAVLINVFKKFRDTKDKSKDKASPKEVVDPMPYLKELRRLQLLLFLFLYSQAVAFAVGTVLLSVFCIGNVSGEA